MSRLFRRVSQVIDDWAQKRAQRMVARRSSQEDLDMLKLAWCCHYYNFHKPQLAKMATDFEDGNSFRDDAFNQEEEYKRFQQVPLIEHRRNLRKAVDKQIMEMFHHIHKYSFSGINPYPPPRSKGADKEMLHKLSSQNQLSEAAKLLLDEELSRKVYREGTLLSHPAGFKLQIRKSQVDHPESGYGVFVFGHIIPGTVIGFYPGTVYYPRELTSEVVKANDYMISRYDGIVIDGRNWAQHSLDSHQEKAFLEMAGIGNASQSKRTSIIEEELKKYRNPFAIANYINHPPLGNEPNVLCFSYDFIDRPKNNNNNQSNNQKKDKKQQDDQEEYVLPEHLRAFVPNKFTDKKHLARWLYQKENVLMPSVIAVATRHIGPGEELFLNYRYNPRNPYPSWYRQPDVQEAMRRWGPTSYFESK